MKELQPIWDYLPGSCEASTKCERGMVSEYHTFLDNIGTAFVFHMWLIIYEPLDAFAKHVHVRILDGHDNLIVSSHG